MRRILLAAATAAVTVTVTLVAGCGAGVDTTKTTYPRTTVPAGQVPAGASTATETGQPRTNDPAFTPEKLRVVDPCALLDDDLLGQLGNPEKNNHSDFGECANYMEDSEGRELNLTLTIGETVSNAVDAEENIGGLPALENMLDSDDACFVTVVTSTSPNLGIAIQVSGSAENLCDAGRMVLTSVVDRIRGDPPRYELAKGTLIDVDGCTFFEAEEFNAALGGDVQRRPFNVRWCNWSGPAGTLGVWFRLGPDPGNGDGTGVDLGGGITGYLEKTGSSAVSCQLNWKHRPYAGEQFEIVSVTFDNRAPAKGEDPCAPVQNLAKDLLPALPKT